MSLRDLPVHDVMTAEVVSFRSDQNVTEAMQQLVARGVDAGPVLDGGQVVGMLSTGDLIVEEARVHFPSVVNFLGVNVTLPFEHQKLDDSMAKALGASVGEVMTDHALTIDADASVEDAATLMHDNDVSRLPVVDGDGALVGIISRGDIVKAVVAGTGEPDAGEPDAGQGDPGTDA
jgi:CBS domain-containing protein